MSVSRRSAAELVQAALTGHVVLSTLHTNDAPSAITLDIEYTGVKPDIDPATVANGIIALMLSVLMSVTQLGSETISNSTSAR